MSTLYYKAVRKDGTSHYDGKTLWTPGVEISVPEAQADGNSCGPGIHGCETLLGAVAHQAGPSKYLTFTATSEVLGRDDRKIRFRSVMPGEYLSAEQVDALAGFKLHEANNPVNPLLIPAESRIPLEEAIALIPQWDSVWASAGNSVWASAWASAGDSVGNSAWASVWASVGASVWDSVGASAGASVRASVWTSVRAYIGGLFPGITTWKYAESLGPDPWRPLLTLWYGGYVPSFDGTPWRLHAGPKAEVVWVGRVVDGKAEEV